MRNRRALALAAVALLPLLGCGPIRHLVSGKLDASQGYDFSCSVVNKSPTDTVEVTMALKDGDGNVYVNPTTFQGAMLTQELGPREAAMLVAPAAFVGVTSLYCWADVPTNATVFGTFLVRDAQGRSKAATPLQEDEGLAGDMLARELSEIDQTLDQLTKLDGPLTGAQAAESCFQALFMPNGDPNSTAVLQESCPAGQLALSGGCEARAVPSSGGDPTQISFFENDALDAGWRCAYENNSAVSNTVELCIYAVCADAVAGD